MRSAVPPCEGPVVARVLWRLLDVILGVRRIEHGGPLHSVTDPPPSLLQVLRLLRPVELHGQVVEPGPGYGSHVTGDDGDQPPVVVLSEHPGPPPGQPCEHPGPEVTGGVDGTARVVAEAEPEAEDGNTDKERNWLLGDAQVARVRDGADTDEEQSSPSELVQQAAEEGEVGGGEGGKDAGGVGQTAILSPVVLVPDEAVPVHTEHRQGGRQRAEVLGGEVVRDLERTFRSGDDWEQHTYFPPWELPYGGDRHCDGGIEMSAGHSATDHHAQHDSDAPAEVTVLVPTIETLSHPQLTERKSP